MSLLPVAIRAESVRVLVVGGGKVATRKAAAFARAGATVRVVAPRVITALRDMASEGRLSIAEREFDAADIGDAQLVVAATDVREVNDAVARAGRAANRLVNRADDAPEGDFYSMAVHQAGDVTVGVTAGGAPAAATLIRDRIAHLVDDRYARAVRQLRELREKSPSWERASRDLLDAEFCDQVERGEFDARIAAWR